VIEKGITISEYITWTQTSAVYPEKHSADYLALGLLDEIGELAGLLKRELREGTPRDMEAILLENSDICWYLARLWPAEYWEREIEQSKSLSLGNHIPNLVAKMAKFTDSTRIFGYLFQLIELFGFTLDQVLEANVAKIEGRKSRGTVMGKGDHR
jgi:hypothetical protein